MRSAQSTHAVCAYCKSTVVRQGDVLARLGKMAELFDDHSPLQLLATGRWEGKGFTLVGRLRYVGESGSWTEWHAALDDGTSAVLGEDNGAYVFSRPFVMSRELPDAEHFRVGATTAIEGKSYKVAANTSVRLASAEGELPRLPNLDHPFVMVELRNADGEVISIDYGTQPPTVDRGRAVALEALSLSGLRSENVRQEKARHFACPQCGAQVEVALENSKSITCRSCNSLIDLSLGIGGEMQHAAQDEPVQLLIPLGAAGKLRGTDWQVVGFQHRMGYEPDDRDEHFGWSEYLLYNRQRGFCFLVDAQDGWSLVKPTTGAPTLADDGQSAKFLGGSYQLQTAYEAETTYVAGEFYWPVVRGQKTSNRDFSNGNKLLSLEQTPKEITWSNGTKIDSDEVAKVFGLSDKSALLKRSDVGPTSAGGGISWTTWIVLFFVFVSIVASCRQENQSSATGSGYRTSGGSYGGSSSGGGHK